MDFVCVCVRIPKCGSTSLTNSLKRAFAGRRIFHLPHSVDFEGEFSCFQRLRFRRSQARSLRGEYQTTDFVEACRRIGRWAADGDLISGGHIDFPSVRAHIGRPVKMITLLRDPLARCRSEYNYCRQAYQKKAAIARIDMTIKHRIAGRFSFPGYLDFLLEHAEIYGNLAARYVGWDGRQTLEDYFARNVFHAGVLEDSIGFALGLARKMGTSVRFPHENKTALRIASAGAAERVKIEKLYPLDLELYEWLVLHYDAEEDSGLEESDFALDIPAWHAHLFNQAKQALFAHA
jgi:hypothetical protein